MTKHYSSGVIDIETPSPLFFKWDDEYHFTLDVCDTRNNHKVEAYFNIDLDAIVQSWAPKRCWMNPPYTKREKKCKVPCTNKTCVKRGFHLDRDQYSIYDWVQKAVEEVQRGALVCALLPSMTDVAWFHDFIYNDETESYYSYIKRLVYIRGRLTFEGKKGKAPFGNMIVLMKCSSSDLI